MVSPLSALSVAAYVVQFLDIASSFVWNTKAHYKTSSVVFEEDQVDNVIKRLRTVLKNLVLPLDCSSATTGSGSSNRSSQQFHGLRDICRRCREISPQLLQLGDISLPQVVGQGKWGKFKKALKTAGIKQELEELSSKLEDLRDEIGFQIIALLKYDICHSVKVDWETNALH